MSKVKIAGHASGSGTLTIQAPDTSSSRTITLPDATGTLLNSDGDGSSLTGLTSSLGDLSDATTTATSNIGIGSTALDSITTGDSNVALGDNALTANTEGDNNVAIGVQALDANTTASDNVAIGYGALGTMVGGTGKNYALGYLTLNSVTDGVSNIGIGYHAGHYDVASGDPITTGDRNVIIGNYSSGSVADSQDQIVIGYALAGASDQSLTFGNATSDTTCSYGSTSWSNPSDERIKQDITTSTAGLGFINDLRPVTFKYKNEGDIPTDFSGYVEGSTTPVINSFTNHGFVAQEVKIAIDAHPELKDGFEMWKEGKDGRQRIGDSSLIPMLVNAIQELSAENDALKDRLTAGGL